MQALTHCLAFAFLLAHSGACFAWQASWGWGGGIPHDVEARRRAPYPNIHGHFFAKSAFSLVRSRS
jgi:hypothetical protein